MGDSIPLPNSKGLRSAGICKMMAASHLAWGSSFHPPNMKAGGSAMKQKALQGCVGPAAALPDCSIRGTGTCRPCPLSCLVSMCGQAVDRAVSDSTPPQNLVGQGGAVSMRMAFTLSGNSNWGSSPHHAGSHYLRLSIFHLKSYTFCSICRIRTALKNNQCECLQAQSKGIQ